MKSLLLRLLTAALAVPLGAFGASVPTKTVLARVEAVDRVDRLNLPIHAHLQDAVGRDYVLAVATEAELQTVGWPYTVLASDPETASLALATEKRPGATKLMLEQSGIRVLYDDGKNLVLNVTTDQIRTLAGLGFAVVRIPAPLAWPVGPTLAPAIRAVTPSAAISNLLAEVQLNTLSNYLSGLSGEQPIVVGGQPYAFSTRFSESGTPIALAEQYAFEFLQARGWQPAYHGFTGLVSGRNVVGVKPGAGPNANEIVLVTAHLDNMPEQGRAPGADDNGSGCVGLMAAADILKDIPTDRTIRLVFCGGEELGLLGSDAYAQACRDAGDRIVAVYNMDMLSYSTRSDRALSLHTRSAASPGYAGDMAVANTFASVVNAYLPGRLTPEIVPDNDAYSDHFSFWLRGFPGILAIESDHDFTPYYHTSNDSLATLNLPYFTDFVKASLGTVAHLAGILTPKPPRPTHVQASNGTFTNQVRVSWDTSAEATQYEILRTRNRVTVSLGEVPALGAGIFDDTTVSPGRVYAYRVVAKNAEAASDPSDPDSGFADDPAATGPLVDLALWNLVLLPATLSTAAAPGLVSFDLENYGPDNLDLSATNVSIRFYTSTDSETLVPDQALGTIGFSVALTAGACQRLVVPRSALAGLTLPTAPGSYPIGAIVSNTSAAGAVDPDPDNNMALRGRPITVLAGPAAPYKGRNDFDADTVSDLAIFDSATGHWYVQSLSGAVLAWATAWGWPGASPVGGDFDGDGAADLAVYDPAGGNWYAWSLARQTSLIWARAWGWNTALTVSGDFDADGVSDLAVFDRANGNWYIWSEAKQTSLAWARPWGWPGAITVPGDYDGDSAADLAVFDAATGHWYAQTLGGSVLVWARSWGWPGAIPMTGDYNGDGLADLAVFDSLSGNWYAAATDGTVLVWAQSWGWPGAVPVSGDYDGDGITDLAVFDSNTGNWFILSADGRLLAWARPWGWAGAVLVR